MKPRSKHVFDPLCAALTVVLVAALASSACVPLPQRVKDEFSAPDGSRPNNFELRSASSKAENNKAQSAPAAGSHEARP